MRSLVTAVLIACVRAYQFAVRPMLVGHCRFHPTCSEYAIEALSRHGPTRGAWLAMKRVLRCRPRGATGFDPVP